MSENLQKGTQSLMKAAWIIALITVLSKFIGFFRDIVIANFYGASLVSDAYFYAYQIPSLSLILLGGVGGPFHSATVAVFSKFIPDEKIKANEHLNKLFNTFTTATFLLFLILGILCFVFSDVIIGFIISQGSPELISLASQHLKIMTPVIVLGGLIGIYYGILVSYKVFTLPNISPIIMSIVIMLAITLVKNDHAGIALAAATTVGAVCQFIIQIPKLRQLGYKFRPNLDIINNPEYKNLLELLFPAILSSTVGQIYVYVDMFFASQLQEGAWTAIGYANRIFQFPVGILVTAFLVPLFPIFSRLVAQNNHDDIRYYFNKGVGLLNFVAFPILAAIIILAPDAVKFVFERGAFDTNATFMVSQALIFLSVAIIPYVFRDSITRIFYAFNDSKTPFLVAFCTIILKVILNMLFVERFGIGGITLSVALVTLCNAILLGIFIKKKIKIDYKPYFINTLKMFIAMLFTLGICLYIHKELTQIIPEGFIFLFAKLFVSALIIFGVYSIFAMLFRIEYFTILKDRLLNKFLKKENNDIQ